LSEPDVDPKRCSVSFVFNSVVFRNWAQFGLPVISTA